MKEPKVIELEEQLVKLTSSFCEEFLNEEYKELCEKMIYKLGRKRNVPFLSGRIEIWAASIIHALGRINFLYDKATKPYIEFRQINDYFGTSKSTVGQKATIIENILRIRYFDPEFSLESIEARNPLKNLAMVNGLIVNIGPLTGKEPEKNEEKPVEKKKEKPVDPNQESLF